MGMYEKDGLGMFHRRLIMLAGVGLLGFLALTAQLGRLSLVQGHELKRDAERRLERLVWEPTVRGRILDRTGRVLARDRPTFDVRIDYAVLGGAWVEVMAVRFARAAQGEAWRELAPEQRDALARAYEPFLEAHLREGLDALASVAGVPPADILERRAEVVRRVGRIAERYASDRKKALEERALARGQELSAELDERLERQARRPVAEQERPHTVIAGVPDRVGFAVMELADRTDLFEAPVLELDTGGAARATGGQIRVALPTCPGLDVGDARDRGYPYRGITVDVDRSTLPAPLRGDGRGDASLSVTVRGTLDAIVGVTRDRVFANDPARRAQWLQEEATAQQVARATTGRGEDRGRYMEGDHVGHTGVEARMEHTLRGLRGVRVRRLDTGQQLVTERTPGRDVTLTLDAMLQARIAAAMSPEVGLAVAQAWHGDPTNRRDDGQPLAGGAVVLDIDSGEVLALVSTPTVDPDDPNPVLTRPDHVLEGDWDSPILNRATSAIYPPGSIAKALTLVWAASRGEQRLHERIECTGHFLPGRPDILRCWIYRPVYGNLTHSIQLERDPDEVDALMCSCNIYFYELGGRLGYDRMVEGYRAFGVGRPPLDAVDCATGILGLIPQRDKNGEPIPVAPTRTDAVLMGIGQGPVAWSPLHAADAYATLARGGQRLGPTLVRDGTPPAAEDIGLEPSAVEAALRGLWLSVNDGRFGTGNHTIINGQRVDYFNAPGVSVWGKTGTAQAVATLTKALRVAPDGRVVDDPDNEPPGTATVYRPVTNRYTHAWFVGLVGPEGGRPRYAISVMMEYAGSGGRVSAPIANQIIHALQAEGYLPNAQPGGPP
ncbi:MAG: penicillin-binding transpeptidase domain-containing protein [Phycisphaerales bacterium JB060]